MASLDEELGLKEAAAESNYFDYVEQKLSRTAGRAKVIDNNKRNTGRAIITENAKFWKEYVSS